uniref:Ig-like domain-containing protein n=1 Tax=Parascaris univalens TaxID=6257 RepID=A0A915BFI1_PARUN
MVALVLIDVAFLLMDAVSYRPFSTCYQKSLVQSRRILGSST